ncbi:endonuclease III [Halopelagius longus]|uniref:Endonuclease III n=1 Tax=Halopelagius longus TaxID=1236180 RepID=A0A1H1C9F3_9EURY|nr:endonuclease III [Halopelagius longus]RDI71128.1 endonuclease III [Halopelagius longus]SDQ60768.1 DNA-(apurinic or apyrimidinic site) lyase /endonuclease III [Halopelagius longus]
MGTRLDSREAQVDEVLDRLYEEYPDTTISLNFSNRLELLIAVMLSAQCTDERVNKETEHLFEKYETVEDYAEADVDELSEDIGSITYHNSKADYIVSSAQTMRDEHGGEVPDTMDELTDLKGVGRKTANVVLQHGHDVVEGIVVDTHVQRLSRRLGITEEETPEKIETDLMPVVPEEDWQQLTHLFISHGRATCTARNPDCADCVLEDVCPSSKLDHDVDLASGETWD